MKRLGLSVGMLVLLAAGVIMILLRRRTSDLAAQARTGDDAIDACGDRIVAGLDSRSAASLETVRACIAIVHNEVPAGWTGGPIVGDRNLGGGPSIGPMQVYRSTAKELGLWTPPDGLDLQGERDAYAEIANDEDRCLDWGCAVFVNKLQIAGGDVASAIRRYNGGGAAATAYQARALAFWSSTWGDSSGEATS